MLLGLRTARTRVGRKARAYARRILASEEGTSSAPESAGAPSGLERLSRAQLVDVAVRSPSSNAAFKAFRLLFQLSNFRSACAAAAHLDLSKLGDSRALLVARAMLASDRGVEGDQLLEKRLEAHEWRPPTTALKSFADTIAESGWAQARKTETLRALLEHLEDSDRSNRQVRRALKWHLYKLVRDIDPDTDLPYFAELDQLDPKNPSYQLRFVEPMRALGYSRELAELLETAELGQGSANLNVVIANLKLDPLWLDTKGIDVSDLAAHLGDLRLLRIADEHSGVSERIGSILRACIDRQRSGFAERTIVEQDTILRQFVRHDEIDLVVDLATAHDLPDTVLPVACCQALQYFVADDSLSANDTFKSVLYEDPGNALAGAGLELTLPRTGTSMMEMLHIRRRIGQGVASAGRSGVRTDTTSGSTKALLFSGDYVRGLYSKRHAQPWRILKSVLGDRFLNYQRLPRAKDSSIFVIADDGVGDELRTAQFYDELTERFGKVTVSCDPRLHALLSRSFPEIGFVPAFRYRRGLHDRHGRLGARLAGLPGKLQRFLTEECGPLLENSDHITFGQNLFFNHFIGEIGRAAPGPYLSATPSSPSPDRTLRVGLLWRSHLRTLWRKFMYLSIEDFAPITGLDGIELWSIQHAIDDDERRFCEENGIRLIDDIDLFNDFDRLATHVKGLDLAVGLSSAPLELAAAVGTPVWMLGFSPENYFLRTRGGATAEDQLTRNSTIVAPPWIDFTAPRQECIDLVFGEARERLLRELDRKRQRPQGLRKGDELRLA